MIIASCDNEVSNFNINDKNCEENFTTSSHKFLSSSTLQTITQDTKALNQVHKNQLIYDDAEKLTRLNVLHNIET